MQKFLHCANSNNVAFQFLRPEVATGVGNIDTFLVRSNSERMKEVNGASGIFLDKFENKNGSYNFFWNIISAKTRMKMLNAVTSRTHLPHGKFDNQQTHYDSVRFYNTLFQGSI